MLRLGGKGRIHTQMLFGLTMLFIVVTILAIGSFQGVAKFRKLTKNIRARATELPLSAELNEKVSDLRVTLYRYRFRKSELGGFVTPAQRNDELWLGQQFTTELAAVENALARYGKQLKAGQASDPMIGDIHQEMETVTKIQEALARIKTLWEIEDCVLGDPAGTGIGEELADLQVYTSQLPGFMSDRMDAFHDHARTEYRTWMFISGITTVLAVSLILFLVQRFHIWIFKPLQILLTGSRIVAAGNFTHRIELPRNDEVAELAAAMNEMTNNFRLIRDDLDRQVQLRTKEVVRSEQLASVGFLAAGVAHEINNPLASIAWSAEALESRLREILPAIQESALHENKTELAERAVDEDDLRILERYLSRIQEEAFRCKGITDSLLDFSRLGEMEKQPTDLGELIHGVIEMVQHLGKYRRKTITFSGNQRVEAAVNPQEIKQVVLNLITNALDSLEEDGAVSVELRTRGSQAEIRVTDNGCGMTAEVLKHLFEPFFTRRRDGQGTGLGLSITYQIIADHGGTIEPASAGPGHGSTFTITLPLVYHEKETERLLQVA